MQLTLRQILGIDPPPTGAAVPAQTTPATSGASDVAGPAAERQPAA